MRKSAIKQSILLAFFYCSYFDHISAQKLFLQEEVKKSIFRQCSICSDNFPNCNYPVFLMQEYGASEQYFHYCHMDYMSGNISLAYHSAQKIISAQHDTAFRPLFMYSKFLYARILYYKNSPGDAIRQYLELLDLKNKPPALTREIYISLATIYMNKKDFAKAIYYFKVQEHDNASYQDPYLLMEIYSSLAICFLKTKQWKQAEQEINKSIQYCKQLNDTAQLREVYLKIAGGYEAVGLETTATAYFTKALQISVLLKDIGQQLTINLQIMRIAEKNKKYKTALQYGKNYIKLAENIRGAKVVPAQGDHEKKNRKYNNSITVLH